MPDTAPSNTNLGVPIDLKLISRRKDFFHPKPRPVSKHRATKSPASLVIQLGDLSGALLKSGSLASLVLGTMLLILYAAAEDAALPPFDASGYGAAIAVFVGVLGFISCALAGFLLAPSFVSTWANDTLPSAAANRIIPKSFFTYTRVFLPFIAGEVFFVCVFLLPEDQARGLMVYCLAFAALFIVNAADSAMTSESYRALDMREKAGKFLEIVSMLAVANGVSVVWAGTILAVVLSAARNIDAISSIDAAVALAAIYVILTTLHIFLASLSISIKRAAIGIGLLAFTFVVSYPGPAMMSAIALRAARIGGGLNMEIYDREARTVEPICVLIRLGAGLSYRPNPERGRCPLPFTSLAKPSEQAEYRAGLLPAATRDLEGGRNALGQPGAFAVICPRESDAPKVHIWECPRP